MKEILYSRNAVYETLRADRRQAFKLEIAEGVKEKGRLREILSLAKERNMPVKRVPRGRLDRLFPTGRRSNELLIIMVVHFLRFLILRLVQVGLQDF